jgi:RHS repeat-associated protein
MVRTRADGGLCEPDPWTCTGSITRYVWAGDQIVWELNAPWNAGPALEATNGQGTAYGQVSYTHAGGIDRPLVITKTGESLVPHQNWRGMFALASRTDGYQSAADIDWPGFHTTPWHGATRVVENWWGSLSTEMRDATGQIYKRNRYYDPASGQFTQPDPIGLAGGLNSYGFAAGDPVSYSDPYGLKVECTTQEGCDLWRTLARRVNSGLQSEDREVRAATRHLARVMNDAWNDPEKTYYIDAWDRSPKWEENTGGGREYDTKDGRGYDILVDSNPTTNHVRSAPWITLAHELGGAVARRYGGWHKDDAPIAENAARTLAGCRSRRGHTSAGGIRGYFVYPVCR